jgi:predicted Zn-dependent protease
MLEAAAREATQAGRAPAEVVARLSAWMRARVRYTGLELRDAAFIPQAPSTTLARGFGDCKDQAALFVALARAAGLRAHTVILSTDSSARAELPGLSTFDHMIAVVEGTPPLFVDPTATQHAPLSLPADDERRPALILAPTTTALTQTPAAPPTANGIREVRQVTLAAKGPGTVVESTEVWGQLAANYRRDWQGVAMTRVREQLEQYVKREYDAASVDEVQLEGLDDVDRPVRLRLTARKANRGFTGDDDAAVLVDVGALLANNLPEVVRTRPERNAPPRKGPLALGYAFTAEIRYAITVPTGFMVKALPPDETRALGVGTLTLRTGRAADGAVTALLTLVVDKPTLTPAELERARTAIVEALEDKPRFVLFHHIGLAAVAEGRAADGLAALRADVAREPDQPMHAVRLGRALMAIGFAPAAREALERALTRAPKSRELRAALAQVLTRDALGRDQAPALDLREAERIYRALRAEDPKDVAPRVALAALLERDAVGERWGKGARLAEAAAEYAKLGDELEHHAEDARYTRVLLRLGRWADAEKVASKLSDAKQRDALSIVAWIGRDGTTPAMARVRSAGIDRAAVAAALEILIDLRRYDDTAVISEELARGSGQEQVIRQMASAFRRVTAEPPPANAHDPFGHVRYFLWTLFGGTVDDVNRLVHPAERVHAFELAALRRQAGAQIGQLPGHVLRDAASSVTLVALDGDESIGWRVRVENIAGDRQEFFVARDGGKLQITPVAILAQRLVAAQRWKEAARVLRWAREGSDTPAQTLATLWDGAREDPAALRLAAAGLLALTTKEPVAFDLLSTCAERPDAPERETCATLFAFGLSKRDEHQRLCDLYPRLQLALSGSRASAHRAYIWSLSRLPDGRDRLEALLGADDPLDPGHAEARNALAMHLLRRGDHDRAIALVAALHAEGKASPGSLNDAAWAMLFAPTLDARAVTWAEEAVRATKRREPAFLGTLASVLAGAGKPDAAREVLFELVRDHRADALTGGDRYTLGAIAAAYGLRDAARAAWSEIVGRKDDESALSVDKLAREQLRRLP